MQLTFLTLVKPIWCLVAATVSGDGSTALQPFLENALGRTQATSIVKISLPYSGVGSGQGSQYDLALAVNAVFSTFTVVNLIKLSVRSFLA